MQRLCSAGSIDHGYENWSNLPVFFTRLKDKFLARIALHSLQPYGSVHNFTKLHIQLRIYDFSTVYTDCRDRGISLLSAIR